jgi:hypothetical protein
MSVRKLLLLTVLAAAAFVPAGGAGATSGVTVTGTILVQSSTQLGSRQADGNTILEVFFSGTKSGLWDWSDTVKLVIHPDGRWTTAGHGSFAGPAPGCGDVRGEWEIAGQGTLNADGTLNGGFRGHSINGSTDPGGFRFSEVGSIDGASGPYTITYAC